MSPFFRTVAGLITMFDGLTSIVLLIAFSVCGLALVSEPAALASLVPSFDTITAQVHD